MTVGQTFSQQFKSGDVVYGISQARAAYINSLPAGVVDHLRAVGQFVLCDEYNNRSFGFVNPHEFGIGSGPSSKQAINANVARHQTSALLNPLQKAVVKEYYDALHGSKYAPLDSVKMKIAEVHAKGNQNHEDLVFRRACKFGIKQVIEVNKGSVHFVLDVPAFMGVPGNRLNDQDIVSKTQHGGHVPITTSELRACYRNREVWVGSGRLKFYFNLIEVNPPWVDNPAVWAVYEAHRIQKGVI